MAAHDIIVLGTSAGGVQALSRLVQDFPARLPAAVFVVCHVGGTGPSALPEILNKWGPLPAQHARDGEAVHPGRIYVAPPDQHMVLAPGVVRLTHGPRENRSRPAIDPLFRTAARVYGRRVVGVILTGSLYDGAAGLLAVRGAGGTAIVQDPAEALIADMPQTARNVAGADHVVPLADIAPLLVRLTRGAEAEQGGGDMADALEQSTRTVEQNIAEQWNGGRAGDLSVFTCPECGGAMWQVNEQELTRFRCHTGHVYYGENLLEEQAEVLEAALWTAVRTFKERTILSRQLAERERQRGHPDAAARFDDEAQVADRYGELIKQHVLHAGATAAGSAAEATGQPQGNGQDAAPPAA